MALRDMNNIEKANAKILKSKGFYVFWQYSHGERSGAYWATHPKLICQYCIITCASKAINDLERVCNRIDVDSSLHSE